MITEMTEQTQQTGGMRVKDKVVIVTGAAQGIGLATAEVLAREGAKVVIVDLDEAMAQKAALSVGGGALGMKANVAAYAECEAVVKAAVEKFGKLDVLVNNAGITKDNLLMRMSEADWDLVMNVNLKGAFNFIKAASRPMLKAHAGRIINIASIVGAEGNAGQANYAASKGGLIALTKSCAREFASRNILCNAIAPGFIRTRLTDAIPPAEKEKLLQKVLLGRMGEPVDVARVVLFLASEDSSYITGAVLHVNGGGYM